MITILAFIAGVVFGGLLELVLVAVMIAGGKDDQ